MLARPSLRTTLAALLGTVALASAHASAQLRPVDAYYEGAAAPQRFAGRIPEGLAVLGRDDRRGAPTLLVGRTAPRAGGRAEVAAAYLLALAPSYGLSARDLSSVVARDFRPTRAGGTFVVFTQVVAGVPVVGARLSLLIDRRGALVAAGGQLFGTEPSYAFARDEALGARDAIEAELAPIATGPSPSLVTAGRGVDGHLRFLLPPSGAASGYALDRAVRAYRVLYPLPQRLAPAIYAELWMPDGGELIAYAIDATDGSVLMRRSLTESDAFDYRVYADATSPFTPVDSVFGDTTPDPAGMPVRGIPAYAMSGLVSVEGINTNPTGLPDPWLPAGASDTRGNNVDAYADLGSPDGFSSGDLRASTTAPGAFEHMYDPLTAPDANGGQRQAAITQLFFTTNWLHDYFYDQGFDEAAGNAQEDTLGRGGVGGDRMNAEAMDYSGRNNANMSTPADGSNPRMQMYLWTGYNEAGVEQGGVTYAVGTAGFGPTEFDVTAPTRVVVDGTAPADDGCQAITNDLTGTIALVERGACSFVQKVSNATAAGALGVIVINNVSPGTITLGGTSTTMTPSLMVALEDGADIRAVEGMMARIFRTQRPDVPSSFDAQVVTHEWGHYLHHRLESFGQLQGRAMSEGWADFISLLALVRPSDDLTGAFPAASWSAQGSDPVYFGTRRVPYSQNRSFNALSFRHISRGEPLPTSHPVGTGPSDNAEIHNAGEIWSTMMFDALVKLLEYSRSSAATYTFEEARDRMAQYVVTGMQLTPNDATYTEQRDAIIAAALENDADDAQRIALAFAGRGAGSCAVSPTRASNDLTGVIEHFALAPRPSISAIDVVAEGLGLRCDADATLDAGEDGTVRVTVRNDGITALAGASVTVSSDATALSFPSGATQAVPTLAAGTDLTLTFAVHLDAAASLTGPATFVADRSASGLCGPVSSSTRAVLDR
ncbi:MAG: M36 family metallopeptidase, partial [Sandaracinaceae bacterium]